MDRTVILCCAARNELHNLTRLVPAWLAYADHVVVADQGSTDGSREFLARFPKVTVIENTDREFNEDHRAKILTAKARSLCTDAALLFLDADETLSANVAGSLEWRSFLASGPGTTGLFRWVNLWGSCRRHIREGRAGGPVHIPFALIDDGRPVQGTKVMHGPRGPGLSDITRRFYFNDVVNLHFFLSNPTVYRKKQNWYKYYWIDKGGRYFHTNRNHCVYERHGIDDTQPSAPEWFESFAEKGIDLSSASNPELMWYDVDILRAFARDGARRFWLADIWNQDWEHLRRMAVEARHPDMPATPVDGPPRWITAYTDLTLGRTTPSKSLTAAGRFLKRKVLP